MINNCNLKDIDKIKELGKLINKNFDKVNDIEEIIKRKEIIGYYDKDNLLGFIIINKCYEIIDLHYIVVNPLYR